MTAAPAAALTAPTATPPIPDLVNNILGGKQYISPSYWLGWAMEKVCGLAESDVATMNKDDAVARLQRYWTEGA